MTADASEPRGVSIMHPDMASALASQHRHEMTAKAGHHARTTLAAQAGETAEACQTAHASQASREVARGSPAPGRGEPAGASPRRAAPAPPRRAAAALPRHLVAYRLVDGGRRRRPSRPLMGHRHLRHPRPLVPHRTWATRGLAVWPTATIDSRLWATPPISHPRSRRITARSGLAARIRATRGLRRLTAGSMSWSRVLPGCTVGNGALGHRFPSPDPGFAAKGAD